MKKRRGCLISIFLVGVGPILFIALPFAFPDNEFLGLLCGALVFLGGIILGVLNLLGKLGDRAEDAEAERLARLTLKTEAKLREMIQEEEEEDY